MSLFNPLYLEIKWGKETNGHNANSEKYRMQQQTNKIQIHQLMAGLGRRVNDQSTITRLRGVVKPDTLIRVGCVQSPFILQLAGPAIMYPFSSMSN
jgi:hypothetical protein